MPSSTINAKGQTTVPAEVRRLIGATTGTQLTWTVLPNGTVSVRAKTKSILEIRGMLKPPKDTPVSIDDMSLGQSWDSFFLGGPRVSDDFLPERATQPPPERESL